MIYEWKSGSRHKVNAQVAGEVCEKLESTIGLTARNLVDASRLEDAPLHNEFEWNDDVAAENWREQQARCVINSLVIKVEERPEIKNARAFFTTSGSNYENINVIFSDKEKTDTVFMRAKSELRSFKMKYAALKELHNVIAAIDALED